jgi:hypothetical protein
MREQTPRRIPIDTEISRPLFLPPRQPVKLRDDPLFWRVVGIVALCAAWAGIGVLLAWRG